MNTRLTIISAATGLTLLIGAGPTLAQDTEEQVVEQQEQQQDTEGQTVEQQEPQDTEGQVVEQQEPQDTEGQTVEQQEPQDTDELIVEQQEQQELRADNLIGMTVQNPEGEEIGSISDLVIDNEGRMTAAVLSVGGFLGIGAKQVGVNWGKLSFDSVQRLARVDASINRDWLEQAPDFLTQEQIEAERQTQRAREQQEQQMQQQEQQMQQQEQQVPATQ